jgi:large subunit ribosomal protein L13
MVTKLKPYNPSPSELIAEWQVIDASDEVLGRLATRVARLLMGKHKPGYVRHLLCGDFVVVTNAASVKVTGKKAEQKVYLRHSQYPGGLRRIPYSRVMATQPERIIKSAVKGMLPRTKLGRRMLSRLKVYAGPEHPHQAQVIGSEKRRPAAGRSGDG